MSRSSRDLVEVRPLLDAVATTQRCTKNVGLTPQHALGHPGGATGVEDVEVIGRRLGGHGVVGISQSLFVIERPMQQWFARPVVHLQQQFQRGDLSRHRSHAGGKAGVVDEPLGSGVVEQVHEFFFDVPVVHVERRHPGLVGAQHALEVFVAVVQVQTEMVLPRLPSRQLGALGMNGESVIDQHVGQTTRTLGQLGEGEASVTPHHSLPVGHGGGHCLIHGAKVELHVCPQFHTVGGNPVRCHALTLSAGVQAGDRSAGVPLVAALSWGTRWGRRAGSATPGSW